MACEALFAMGFDEEVVTWANRSAQPHRARTDHRGRGGVITAWQDHLGQFFLLDEWITHFEHTIDEVGWRDTVATWAPRLMPSLETKLFHALIRTAHATRAVENADTSPRRHELALALGYWACASRTQKEESCRRQLQKRCCAKDGGLLALQRRPTGVGAKPP